MKLLNHTPHSYQLPGEEPMTARLFLRAVYRALVYSVMLGVSAGGVFIFAYAVANMVGYP